MDHNHPQNTTCTHCACNNPVINILKDDLFHPSVLSKLSGDLKTFTEPDGETVLITGGIIRPIINGHTGTVEAIGIHKGKVVAAGNLADVEQAMNATGHKFTTRTLTDGQTLLPGLIEPHVHVVPTAMMAGWLDLGRFNGQDLLPVYDKEWLTTQLHNYAHEHKIALELGGWILGRGLDPALMPFINTVEEPGNQLITINYELLDGIDNKHPVYIISASMHTAYVNSKALEAIYKSSKEVQQEFSSVQEYITKTNGQLQEEAQMKPAILSIPKLQLAEMTLSAFKHLTEMFDTAGSRGITFMYDAGMTGMYADILKAYNALHQKKVRVGAAHLCENDNDIDNLPAFSIPSEYTDVYYGHAKIVSDGSNQGLTGFQSVDYCCTALHPKGIFNFPQDNSFVPVPPEVAPPNYNAMIHKIAVDKGWPIMIHANGDRAVDYAMQVYTNAIAETGVVARHRIEHCSILTPDHITAMGKLGISPSFLIGHIGYWGYAFSETIFKEKAQKMDLCKSSLDQGLKITLHSDNSVSPMGPLRMMEQSITRIMEAAPDPQNSVLNPSECITAEQALVAITNDAAWQCYAENWVGSLNADNFADFVILAQDPLSITTPYMNIRNIPVLETWKGGVKVYTNPN